MVMVWSCECVMVWRCDDIEVCVCVCVCVRRACMHACVCVACVHACVCVCVCVHVYLNLWQNTDVLHRREHMDLNLQHLSVLVQ